MEIAFNVNTKIANLNRFAIILDKNLISMGDYQRNFLRSCLAVTPWRYTP